MTRRSFPTEKKNQSDTTFAGYNIYFSYCRSDQLICNQIETYLIEEGYSVCQNSSKSPVALSNLDRSDVMLVGFSEDYSNDFDCMNELNHAKSISKHVIPFLLERNTDENQWISSLTIATLFYELFDRDIDLQFIDDFDSEYDQLLCTLC